MVIMTNISLTFKPNDIVNYYYINLIIFFNYSDKKTMKYVYLFGGNHTEGGAKQQNILGGKGANLAEMSKLKIPVPPGFTISILFISYFPKKSIKKCFFNNFELHIYKINLILHAFHKNALF